MFMSLIIVLCDVCLYKVKSFFALQFTFSHVCMLILMYLILPNYWIYVVSSFLFSFPCSICVIWLWFWLWARYAECLNKRMFCSVLFKTWEDKDIIVLQRMMMVRKSRFRKSKIHFVGILLLSWKICQSAINVRVR